MTKEKLSIKGMHCASCAFNIDEELEEVDGVSKSKTSYRRQTTEVQFDETRTGLDKIHEAIKRAGYEVAS
ncbi:MAG: heavy-metal-associated domain-containing protein [Actinomycetota bacterium]